MGWTPSIRWKHRKGRKPYAVTQIGGREIHLGTDRKAAEREYHRLMAGYDPPSRPTHFAEATLAYSREHPSDFEERRIKTWLAFRPKALMGDLTSELLVAFVRWQQKRGLAPRTIRHNVSVIRKVMRWCADESRGWLSSVPASPPMPRADRTPRDIPTETLGDVVNRVPARSWPIVGFILNTGCRPSEARRLRWSHVRIKDGFCQLPAVESKTGHRTGRSRTIWLTPEAVEIVKVEHDKYLKRVIEEAKKRKRQGGKLTDVPVDDFVFLTRLRGPYRPSGLRTILRRAGWSRTYSLRHTFAQNALDQGKPIEVVAALLGHSDLRTVQVYAQIRNQRARQEAVSLAPPVRRGASSPKPDATEAEPTPPAAPAPKTPGSAARTDAKPSARKAKRA